MKAQLVDIEDLPVFKVEVYDWKAIDDYYMGDGHTPEETRQHFNMSLSTWTAACKRGDIFYIPRRPKPQKVAPQFAATPQRKVPSLPSYSRPRGRPRKNAKRTKAKR